MTIIQRKFKFFILISLVITLLFLVTGCGSKATDSPSTGTPSTGAPTTDTGTPSASKKMPDQMTKIKVAIPTQNIDYLPWFVAVQKGIFKKYNLDVDIQKVDGGVIGLRGLQSGDFAFLGTLPESVIVGVSQGANAKLIGTLTAQSMYTVFVTSDIKKIEDLKGKAAAVVQPGSGNDTILRWWLKHHGLVPDKDVRIIAAGGNPERVQALKTGQAQVTLLSPPTDLKAEKTGLKNMGLIRDELTSYNHDTIAASGTVLKDTPELAHAFMAATAEAIQFVKDPANRAEVTQIGTKVLATTEQDLMKSLDFAIPSYGDKGKLNLDGIKWAIDTAKETGNLNKVIKVEDVVDVRYYSE